MAQSRGRRSKAAPNRRLMATFVAVAAVSAGAAESEPKPFIRNEQPVPRKPPTPIVKDVGANADAGATGLDAGVGSGGKADGGVKP